MRAKKELWLSGQKNKIDKFFFYLLILFLPVQLGRHFWPAFSTTQGIRIDYLSPTIFATDILIIIIAFAYLRSSNIKTIKFSKKAALLILFIISVLLSAIFSKNKTLSFYGFLKIIEFLFLGFYVFKTHKNLNKKTMVVLFSTSLIFESLLASAQFISQSSLNALFYLFGERSFTSSTPGIANADIGGQLLLRPYATFPHPNVLSGYILIVLLFIFSYNKIFSSKREKFLLGVVILLGTIALIITFSRIAIFLWISFIFFEFLRFFWNKSFFLKTLFMASTLIFLLVIATGPLGARFFSTSLKEESVKDRQALVVKSLMLIKSNPFFGVGPKNFIISIAKNKTSSSKVLLLQPVHNIYLLVLAELGFSGFLFFAGFIYIALLKIKRSKTLPFVLPFFAVLFLGFFDHYFFTLQQGQILSAIVFGQVLARNRNA